MYELGVSQRVFFGEIENVACRAKYIGLDIDSISRSNAKKGR